MLRPLYDGSSSLEFYLVCTNFLCHRVIKRTQQGEPQLRFAQLVEELRKATTRNGFFSDLEKFRALESLAPAK